MSEGGAPRRRRRTQPPRRALPKIVLRPWVLPAAIAAVVIIAIIVVVSAVSHWLSPAGNSVEVPALTGMQYNDAESLAGRVRLTLRVVARKPDYHAPKDQIVGQLPAAGEHVREGRVVDVVVSDGQPEAKVPNVAMMSVRDATVTLENARLDVGSVQQQHNDDVTEGTVLQQTPDALSQVPAGTKVDLVVAVGAPVTYAPNIVGMSIDAAVAAAKEAHVALASPVPMPIAPKAPPKGVIVAQDPIAGELLRPHERLTFQVSGGAPATPTPSPSPIAATQAPTTPLITGPGTTLESGSPAASPTPPPGPRGLRVSVALPQSPEPARIRVVLVDATGSRTLYDQVTRGGFTLSFDLTVTGAASLQTYVGDALVNSTSL